MPVVTGQGELEKLTMRHAVKVSSQTGVSVEEVGLAVGQVVGYHSVKSASRMNSAVVIFLDEVNKVEQVVETGIVLRDTFTPVYLLVNPATKIMISNAPPFIKNDDLCKSLCRYGQVVSPIKMVLLGCKSPKLKHVVCHRRQVFMILKDSESPINLTLTFRVEGFNYIVFVTSDTMKCFGCGAEGHLVRACPEVRKGNPGGSDSDPSGGAGGSGAGPSGRAGSSGFGTGLGSGHSGEPGGPPEQEKEAVFSGLSGSTEGRPGEGCTGAGNSSERPQISELRMRDVKERGEKAKQPDVNECADTAAEKTVNTPNNNNEDVSSDGCMDEVFDESCLSVSSGKRKKKVDKGLGGRKEQEDFTEPL
ncbi:hypothetical protein D5F01_LYC05649 [Larimichthys crocea]|uniref:CCHC-type domain-containing protein n=1 Tax=Larimichthys crocea TaxID=215358 RepID=A0A6G0IZE2_LARCR|nr:hypothetical protein D5F01_LYC05649 [Larimichthys crocea]